MRRLDRACSVRAGTRDARTRALSTRSANNPALFTPEAVAAINRAYARACAIVAGEGTRHGLRRKLAEHMMHLARSGETDEGRLCSLSVTEVLGRGRAARDRPRPV